VPRSPKSRHDHGPSEVWERPALKRAIKREQQKLGLRLRALREKKGLMQEDAAEKMGVHAKHVSRMEMGDANVTIATLVAAAVAYGVPLKVLFEE
jgi:DNA-binding XRE family transcriptional regulator